MKKIIVLVLLVSNYLGAQQVEIIGSQESGTLLLGVAENLSSVKLNNKFIPINEDGTFILGFDRNDYGTYNLILKYKNKSSLLKKLTIKRKKYSTQRINNLDEKLIKPPDSELPRIERERKILKTAIKTDLLDGRSLYNSGFQSPIKNAKITGVFGNKRILNGTPKDPHSGVDLASPKGKPVKATADAIVQLVCENFYYAGNMVVLDHGHGLKSFYIHLSKILVNKGDRIEKGEILGRVGSTGRATGPHLHWSVKWHNKRIDPLNLLKLKLKKF